MKGKWKTIRVILMIAVVAVLAAGTIFEKYRGAEWVGDHFYGSWWFAVLMGLVAVGAIVAIVQGRLWHRPAALLIHASIPVILLGGALTTWTGEHYSITLAPGETKEGITLERFEVLYYPGTHTPMDFVSHVLVNGESNGNDSHNSRFTIHNSPFTIHDSQFTIHNSPFTIHDSPFTIHDSQFTGHSRTFFAGRAITLLFLRCIVSRYYK